MASWPEPERKHVRALDVEQSDHLARLEMLLMQAEEAISLVRRMMRDVMHDEPRGGYGVRQPLEGASDLSSLPFFRSELFQQFAGGSATSNEATNARTWEFMTRALIRDRFGAIGHVGAGVLVRLLCAPGEFVSSDDLARAAGVRSSSSRVVKVYICRLRMALAELGLGATVIETGRRSYRLQEEAASIILATLRDVTERSSK